MKFFLLPLFVLFSFSCFSQNEVLIDSLNTVLETKKDWNKGEKALLYLKLAKLYRRVNPQEQLLMARFALKESKAILDIKTQGIALSEIASHYQKADIYDSAYFYYKEAIPYFRSKKNIGNSYSRLSNVEKARGNYVESIELLIKSDSIYEDINFKQGRLANNTNLGILLSTQGEFEQAIQYYKKAELLLNKKDERTKSLLYSNFAITYNELGDLENSKKYTAQSIPIKKKLNDIYGLANAYTNLSSLARKEGDLKKGISYLEKAIDAYKKVNNKNGIAGSYNSLGNIYKTQRKIKKAEHYLLQAYILTQETKNHEALMSIEESLYKLYRDTGQWDKAYKHLNIYTGLKDSITRIEKLKIAKELQTKYEIDRIVKDKELAEAGVKLAEEETKNSKSFGIAMAALGGIILITALFVGYRYKAKKRQEVLSLQLKESEKQIKLEQQTRVSELKALQSQMNPHFVFNALNSIQDLILLQDIRNSNKYLGKFSDLIRRILTSSNAGSISITEELKTLQLYAELEQLRFGDKLQIDFINDVAKEICDDYKLPVMFIQPYVENALKHGLLHKEGAKKLTVHFFKEAEAIVCAIIDNGVGRQRANKIKLKGNTDHLNFSSQANQERIDLINAGRTEKIKIEIIDLETGHEASGTKVQLFFPFNEM